MARRSLKKSDDCILAGVCGGIAEYFGWGTKQVRAIFVFLALVGGSGLLAYLILRFAMPAADSGSPRDFNLEDFMKQ